LALPQPASAVHHTDLGAPAAPAAEPIRPTTGEQVVPTRLLGREALLEVQDRHREARARHPVKLRTSPDGTNRVCTSSVNPRCAPPGRALRSNDLPVAEGGQTR